jgi:hypothetical protein
MDFFVYFFSALIAFLGLFLGGLFSHTIREELHHLKHFLPVLQLITLVLSFLLLYIAFPFYIVSVLFLFTFIFIWMFWHKKDHNVLDYIVFAIIFVITSLQPMMHYYMTLLLFLFGFFAGGLFYSLHTKPKKTTKKAAKKKTKNTHKDDYHPHVAHHKHSGKNYDHSLIMRSILVKYFFFLPLTILAYIVAQLLTYFF